MGRPLRPLLLLTTALLAPIQAGAQATDARPQGGAVVAGQATISQTAGRTQIQQSTDRAVIEWRGFDIGARHQVDIRQPGAASWSLQRVTGPDPSAIAGRLTSNGGVAIVNRAGVVFQNGAQVDVAGLIATASDTTNEAFMAGRMAFDGRPNPGARVENRGSITVREQGLAALVGPVAANSGTIRARLGRVAVAGGEAFALDLAGDGLLSLDVTRQVSAAPSGATALATNSGNIEAEGGHVLLTARAASGVLETLVEAGGRVNAASITVTAPGGGVRVPSGAALDASGATGGGRVTVGAGSASRMGAPVQLSARTTVERGATLRADATRRGNGGRVIVHSADRTELRGDISARGGAEGGRGGEIEVSSRGRLLVDGTLRAGADGTVLIDPEELQIVDVLTGSAEPEEIAASTVNTTEGHLILQAERRIRVLAAVNRDAGPLTLETINATAQTGDGISVEAPLSVLGDLRLRSAGDIVQNDGGAGITAITLHAESRAGAVRLEAFDNQVFALDGGLAAGRFDVASTTSLAVDAPITAGDMRLTSLDGIALYAPVQAGSVELVALGYGGIAQQAGGAGIATNLLRLESPFAAIRLDGAGNRIAALGDSTASAGLTLRNAQGLHIAGTLNALDASVAITVEAGDLTQDADIARVYAERLAVAAPGGSVLLDGAHNLVARASGSARDAFTLDVGRTLVLEGPVSGARVTLTARGDLIQETDALVVTPLLAVRALGGAVLLQDPLNDVAALGAASADAHLALATSGRLALTGVVAAPEVALLAAGDIVQGTGSVQAGLLRVTSLAGSVALDGPGNRVASLGASGAATGLALTTTGALDVAEAVQTGLGTLRLDGESIRLLGTVNAPQLSLAAWGGGIAQDAGTVAASVVGAEAVADVRLDAPGNAIAFVSGNAGGLFRVATASALVPQGIFAPEVALAAGGAVTQAEAGLGIATDLLSVASGARVELSAAANAVRALGRVVAPGGLLLRTGTALQLANIADPISVPDATLLVGGDLTQLTGATLAAGTLRVEATGNVALTTAGNALPRLLGAAAGGTFGLTTSGPLALEGPLRAGDVVTLTALGEITQPAGLVEAPVLVARSVFAGVKLEGENLLGAAGGGAAGTWRLRQAGTHAMRLAGLIAAPEVLLDLAGGLDQAAGALRADVLGLDVAGTVMLDSANHRVAALSGRAGELWLAAGGPLDVTGGLQVVGALGLSADRIGLAAPVSAGGSGVLVALAGDVAQAASGAGLSLGGGLQVHAAGAVALDGAGNQVARLAAGTAGGGFALAGTGALTVAGTVAGETVVLRAGGPMTLDGAAFEAGRAVLLAAPAGFAAGAQTSLVPRDAGRLPVLILDTRQSGGLAALPDSVQPDLPGLAATAQPTQLAAFGSASNAAGGGIAFDIQAGASPVFLLLDGAPAVGTLEAGRLGVLGRGASAFLSGVLGGVGGAEAAALASVAGNDTGYRFNDCPMGLPNCGAIEPPPPPPPGPGPGSGPGPEPGAGPAGPGPEPGPGPDPAGQEPPPPPLRVGLPGTKGGWWPGAEAPTLAWSPWPGTWLPAPLLREDEE